MRADKLRLGIDWWVPVAFEPSGAQAASPPTSTDFSAGV
jgi:hypothetical protein